jgi:hypothetical protein
MATSSDIDKRRNKSFVINNQVFLKQYALKNYEIYGSGVIVVNLLLLKTELLDDLDWDNYSPDSEPTIHQPVAYIPEKNFWFKTINLKIKKKHQINIQSEDNLNNKFLVVFIKDASIEYFSIYSLKL